MCFPSTPDEFYGQIGQQKANWFARNSSQKYCANTSAFFLFQKLTEILHKGQESQIKNVVIFHRFMTVTHRTLESTAMLAEAVHSSALS